MAIETSNPTSGPRGRDSEGCVIGPGIALGTMTPHQDLLVDEPLAETSRHDDDLMPAIERVLKKAGAKPRDLACVAVSVGPGGYTGVRIAIAAAKLIAEAVGAKTVAVKSYESAAWRIEFDRATLICLASKNNLTHATALPTREWWNDQEAAINQIASAEDFACADTRVSEGKQWIAAACMLGVIGVEQIAALKPERLVADKYLPAPIGTWAENSGVEIVEPVFSPASVFQIGIGMNPADPADLQPIYPREPDAVRQWRLRKSGN